MPGPKVEKCNLNINLAGILNKKISRVSDNQTPFCEYFHLHSKYSGGVRENVQWKGMVITLT